MKTNETALSRAYNDALDKIAIMEAELMELAKTLTTQKQHIADLDGVVQKLADENRLLREKVGAK